MVEVNLRDALLTERAYAFLRGIYPRFQLRLHHLALFLDGIQLRLHLRACLRAIRRDSIFLRPPYLLHLIPCVAVVSRREKFLLGLSQCEHGPRHRLGFVFLLFCARLNLEHFGI